MVGRLVLHQVHSHLRPPRPPPLPHLKCITVVIFVQTNKFCRNHNLFNLLFIILPHNTTAPLSPENVAIKRIVSRIPPVGHKNNPAAAKSGHKQTPALAIYITTTRFATDTKTMCKNQLPLSTRRVARLMR